MHPARFSRPKSTFLTIPILIAGTNSVSSGNFVEESFFDKYFADIKGSHDNLKEGFTSFFFILLVEIQWGFTQKNLLFRKTASARHSII